MKSKMHLNLQFFAEEVEEHEQEEKETNESEKQNESNNKTEEQFLKEFGVENKEDLLSIIKKHREREDNEKSDLDRANESLKTALAELAREKEARIVSDAKVLAISLGAKTELLEDLIVIAKNKVTKEKDVKTVLTEIKQSERGKTYFGNEDESSNETRRETGRRTKRTKNEHENNDSRYDGTFAERMLKGNKKQNKSYFSN